MLLRIIALLIFTALAFACGDGNNDGYNSAYKTNEPGPATTVESSYRMSGINHLQGKSESGFYYFGDSKPSGAAVEAVTKGMQRTFAVLEQEYPQNAKDLVRDSGYAVVFWKPSPLCTTAPAFTISYIPLAGSGDPYDDGEYDKDPRKGRVTICAAGKSGLHTWLQNKPEGVASPAHRIDIVEDATGTGEGATRHEALHLGLLDLDPARYQATIYHGGDWEAILAKVNGAAGFASLPNKTQPAKIETEIEGERVAFSVIVVR